MKKSIFASVFPQIIAGRALAQFRKAEFNEEDHPRDDAGKFSDKGNGESSGSIDSTGASAEQSSSDSPNSNSNKTRQWENITEAVSVNKFLSKDIKTPNGSRYYDFTVGDDWVHARIADHSNRTESADRKNLNATIRSSIHDSNGLSMDMPHDFNIIVSQSIEKESDAKKLLTEVINSTPKQFRSKTKFDDGTVYGSEVDVKVSADEFVFSDRGGEKDDFTVKRKK